VKKTFKNAELNLISQLSLSIIVMLMGVVIIIFKSFGLIDVNLYVSILFYIYAFFSTIMYFVKRKEGDYELLLLSLINIITATFINIFKADNVAMILGAAMTIYTILITANRGYKAYSLKRNNSYMWIIKFIVTFLIAFLGILTAYNLYNEVTVQTMMFGFYFISLGFMLTVEDIIELFMTDEKLKKLLAKVLEDEPKRDLEEVKEESPKKTKPKTKKENEEKPKRETRTKTSNLK